MNATINKINYQLMLRRYYQNLSVEAQEQLFMYSMNADNHEFIWKCAEDFKTMFTHHDDEEAD
jgi:hypothetical protein